MSSEMRDDSSTEIDPLADITIDERFKAAAPGDKTVSSDSAGKKNPHISATVSTPQHLTPDSFAAKSEHAEDALIGQMIGNYEVVSQLGKGGFGTVYKAKDTKLQRFAALKFLRFPLDGEFRKMFEREAQVIANLGKHASIVQIFSWGEHQGSQYFALEFLDTSVEAQIKRRGEPLSVKQALEIIADCAGALHYAHQQGVLHRDVKPANILIDSKTGRAKVCDFGLAKFNSLATGTDTRTIAGSPPYMAPEQIVGKNMDARTDVYSLGVTLYEMLSKELPCKGSSQVEVMDNIRSRKSTPLRVYRPDLSDSILEIVKQATAFLPEDRFQSAEEMQAAAQAVLRSLETTGSTDNVVVKSRRFGGSKKARVRNRALIAAGIAFVLIVAGSIAAPRMFPSDSGEISTTGTLWPTAVAAAKDQIDAGEYEAAITYLEGYLETNESEDFAQYALGYARLLSNQVPEAEAAFTKVEDIGLREEGLAAVKHATLGEESRPSLQEASTQSSSAYPAVLLASLDVLNNHYDEAIKRLEGVDQNELNFGWQRARYREMMGRAYYNTQNFQKAEQYFGDAGSVGMAASIAPIYMARTEHELDDTRLAALNQQIDQIKQVAEQIKSSDGAAAGGDDDEWTSRPIRVRVEPARGNNCRVAIEEGLVDVFSDLMADSLIDNSEVPLELVDREYIGDVLYEQQLAQLSKDVDRIQLQKLLGARVMIESEFRAVMNENYVWVKIIDTETTKFTKVESEAFDRRTNAREWARNLGTKAAAAIQKAYPVQGILTKGSSGAELNVGSTVGVEQGMRFAVHTAPGAEHRLANVTAVASNVGATMSTVTLEPVGATIPEGGWYLQQIQ